MRNIVSLFDESGNMVRDWAIAGYSCYCFDIENDNRVEKIGAGSIMFVKADLLDVTLYPRIIALRPRIVFGFPPCTDLAVSGAPNFAAKRGRNPNFQVEAVALCRVVETIGQACWVPWMLENPRSVLATMWRKSNFDFEPWHYGGYLETWDRHPRWPEYIAPRDAYPKTTYIWCGGGFSMPPTQSVGIEPGYSTQHKMLGGKSKKTKQIRSETPRGFAKAVFLHYNPKA